MTRQVKLMKNRLNQGEENIINQEDRPVIYYKNYALKTEKHLLTVIPDYNVAKRLLDALSVQDEFIWILI